MGDEMENGVEKLLAAVRAGESGEVPALLEPLDAAAREAALVRLKALRAEVRAGKWATPPDAPDRIRGALYVAGAGCLPTAAANRSGRWVRQAPTSRPPLLPPAMARCRREV